MISNIVRSLAIAGALVGTTLPLTLAMGGAINSAVTQAIVAAKPDDLAVIEKDLSKDCFRWMVSKAKTTVEKDAEKNIDEYLGGSVDYETVCDWVLN